MAFSVVKSKCASRTSRLKCFLCVAALLSACVGCKVGPNYRTPGVEVKTEWSMQHHVRLQGQPVEIATWWKHFNDPVLDQLVQCAVSENLTLREAGQRIIEARARRDFAHGNLFPQVQTINGGYSRTRLSSNEANFFAIPGVFIPNITPDAWTAGMSAAWELDFWGRYRRAVESADASLEATIAAYDEATVILLAELAQAYVETRTAEARLNLARANLETQSKTVDVAKRKKAAGVASAIDVAQAELNYGRTAALLPDLEIQRVQAMNRLSVLMGQQPQDLLPILGYTGAIPFPSSDVSVYVPADLVRRRPEIRRVERELAAQSERIGIAQTDFYPQISITGSIGVASQNLDRLFTSASQVGLLAPQASWNIFNYGRIRANVEAEQAAFESLCYQYRNTVLEALREAEDAQVAYALGYDRVNSLLVASKGAETAVKKSEESYQAGTVDFARIYILQSELLLQQDALAVARGEISSSLIALFRAMGGGWEVGRLGAPGCGASACGVVVGESHPIVEESHPILEQSSPIEMISPPQEESDPSTPLDGSTELPPEITGEI